MSDKENCNCGSNPCCGDCEPWNCIEQAVNDVWSTKEGQIEELVERAETAAENSEASAQASAGSAAEAKEFRDEAEQAATTAVAAEGVVVGVANSLQDTADKLKQIADELGTAIAGISVVTWYYTAVSDNQTVIPVPTDKNQVDVQAIYIEGARQDPNRGFSYDALNKEIILAEGIPLGMEISIIIGTYSDNPNDFSNTLASNNGASLVGTSSGKTVQVELNEIHNSLDGLDTTVRSDLASTVAGKGDELIAVKQPYAGSTAITQHFKNAEVVSIRDFGGLPDNATDCWPALQAIRNVNSSGIVKFPYIPDSINIYKFNTMTPSLLGKLVFDVDPGVVLSDPNGFLFGEPYAQNIDFVRPTNIFVVPLNATYQVSSDNRTYYNEKDTFLESTAYDYSKVSIVMANTELTPVKVAWPLGDTFTADAFNTSDANSVVFAYTTGDNNFHVAVKPLIPGETYTAYMGVSANYPPIAAVVRTNYGYYTIFGESVLTGGSITLGYKAPGKTPVQVVVTPVMTDHLSYAAIQSEWAIRVNSFQSFDILFNGYLVTTVGTEGFIQDGGFGAYFSGGATGTQSVNIINHVSRTNGRSMRSGFTTIKVFGDSTSAPRLDCWPLFLQRELEFSEGNRTWDIINKAVPGQASGEQLAIMQADGLSDANVVIISVGTNDVQGQVPLQTFISNVQTMINLCKTAGLPVVLVKFGLWYTQTQAPGRGQPSVQYQWGAAYRSAVARLAAENGVKLVDLPEVLGPIVSYYVNPNLHLNMVDKGDSVVWDNIHPTTAANRLIARTIAKAIMGVITFKVTKDVPDMPVISATNNWLINNDDTRATITVTHDGQVSCYGRIWRSTGVFVDGTVIAKLPSNIAPLATVESTVASDQTSPVRVTIKANGDIAVYGATTTLNYLSLGGIGWRMKRV